MNASVRSAILLVAVVTILLGGFAGYFVGYRASDAHHAALALDVQQANEKRSRLLQQQAAKQAELTRQVQASERERIDAIKTIDHQSAEIKRLDQRLAQFVAEERKRATQAGKDKDPLPGRYHVFDADVIERVWDEAVRSSGQP